MAEFDAKSAKNAKFAKKKTLALAMRPDMREAQ